MIGMRGIFVTLSKVYANVSIIFVVQAVMTVRRQHQANGPGHCDSMEAVSSAVSSTIKRREKLLFFPCGSRYHCLTQTDFCVAETVATSVSVDDMDLREKNANIVV